MPVEFNFEKKLFTLQSANSMYQFKVDEFGVLKHLWYGAKIACDMEYLQDYHSVGFSPNIFDARKKRNYSHDTLPLEYSCVGTGDYRICAASVVHSDGSCALDLRYESHKIFCGKYSIPGLPASFANEKEAQTLEVQLKDKFSQVRVTLKYCVFEEYDAIARCAVFENMGAQNVRIKNAASFCLDFANDQICEEIDFPGKWGCERIPARNKIARGIKEISSARGSSSHQHNPAVILCEKNCSETQGLCYGALLVYSGSFSAKIECDQINQTRLVMGINPEQFCWQLKPGEKFFTPEAILSYSDFGFETLSNNFHKTIQNHICHKKYKNAVRPVLINNWEATYFDFDEEKLFSLAKEAAALGIDMLVIDDGWFGKRCNDKSSLGDWYVNEKKIKGGLCSLTKKIAALGMKTGLWFEPEMISEDSDLYRAHPDYAIKIPGRDPVFCREQLVLDLSRKEVRDFIFESICSILDNAQISYIKWDFNRNLCDWHSKEIPPEQTGEMSHRYVLGLYDLLERVTKKYPDILIEGCSGGGGRFDAGILFYCPQIWCSDNTDAFSRTLIQYGTSFFYPICTVGSHVSAIPNHQTGRTANFDARAIVAMAGSFGYEMDVSKLSAEEKNAAKEQIATYKKFQKTIFEGKYFRLSNPLEENFFAWEFVSPDKKEILVFALIFRCETNSLQHRIKLRGLDPKKNYRLENSQNAKSFSGLALEKGGLLLPHAWGDYFPCKFFLKEE